MKRVTFIITVGLPGSGKTVHADKLYERLTRKHNKDVGYVQEIKARNLGFMQSVYEEIKSYKTVNDYVIIDILPRDLNHLKMMKEEIEEQAMLCDVAPDFEVHLFKPDFEASVVNDFIRDRDLKSSRLIKYMYEYWEFTTQNIVELFGNILVEHFETHQPGKEEIAIWEAKELDKYVTGKAIRSETRTTGGWDRDWMGSDSMEPLKVDPELGEFTILKEFLKRYMGDEYTEEIYEAVMKEVEIVKGEHEEEWYSLWEYEYYYIETKRVLQIIDYYKEEEK